VELLRANLGEGPNADDGFSLGRRIIQKGYGTDNPIELTVFKDGEYARSPYNIVERTAIRCRAYDQAFSGV
jgi:hypothetical protein